MLVGRASESARIDSLLNEVRGGAGCALMLLGEPGIGKSALLEYAGRQAADIKRLSVLGVAAEAASREPLIIIVDDAHWLDTETVNALAFVARRIEDESIGVLVGARSSEPFEMPGVPQLRLGGVGLPEAVALVGQAGYDVAPEVVAALCDVVGGNPLALLELPGVLDADQRAGRRPLDDQLTVTASVERAFLTRIERLDAEGRQAVLLAAASDSDDAEAIRGAAPEAAAGLEQAERIGLVRVQRDRIAFWHPLVRSAVYTAATDEERRAAHRALAAGLLAAHPARRAWHLVAAGAEPDDGLSGDLADAGAAARRRGACAGAARLLERAALGDPGPGATGPAAAARR